MAHAIERLIYFVCERAGFKWVGAVGGKIVLLDGSLQEAGSIIWSDGSCKGYGRGRVPRDPEFQFRREVDYCSGAFLMVRRTLFESLNRFDPAFAPAYYEETDLCMRIRAAGFRVVYEPTVEILHFEFGSSSSSQAAIALQQRNRELFCERHAAALRECHPAPGTRELNARMINHYAGRILVIDDQVPYPALGAGYPRANSILSAIHGAGWFVTFYPLVIPTVAWDKAYELLRRISKSWLTKELMVLHLFWRNGSDITTLFWSVVPTI